MSVQVAAKQHNLLDLIPIFVTTLLLATVATDFEQQLITISSVGVVHASPLRAMVIRDALVLMFGVTCWLAVSSQGKWLRRAIWCLPMGLLLVVAARPALGMLIMESNGAGLVIGLWWATILGLAFLFFRANRWAGGLMVPHVLYATYVATAVGLTWMKW